jgi:pimeloyl-ACP methyl ester carboxylesterase
LGHRQSAPLTALDRPTSDASISDVLVRLNQRPTGVRRGGVMTSTAPKPTSPASPAATEPPAAARQGHIGRIVALSLGAGLVLALLLVLVVFPGAREYLTTGVLLLGFAAGWALLAALSTRRTDQPQRWAWVPALAMGATGAALLLFAPGNDALSLLGWVWPPLLVVLVVWCVLGARRQLRSRTRAWLVYPVLAVLALVAVGGAVETVLETSDSTTAPSADMYDVGGHRLYLHCQGTGAPTVVLSNGLFEHAAAWAWVQQAVSADTRVCVYDRAGEGFSDTASAPQDGRTLAADLHTLLARAHIPGPYVLAGHSVGGAYALVYAARYPDQVAGVALIDSATPYQFELPGYSRDYALMLRRGSGLLPTLARFGVARLAFGPGFAGLPPAARDQERAFTSSARDFRGARDEISQFPTAFRQAQQLTSLGDTPLYVLTAGQGQQTGWAAAQDDLATLSTNVTHTVTDASHAVLLEDHTASAATSDAIRAVVNAVRTGTALPSR